MIKVYQEGENRSAEPSLRDLKNEARILMRRIRVCCEAQENPERQMELIQDEYGSSGQDSSGHNEKAQPETKFLELVRILSLGGFSAPVEIDVEISRLRYRLEWVKSGLVEASSKMKGNAEHLEPGFLHDPEVGANVRRGAEIALAEADRIDKLCLEIEEFLDETKERKPARGIYHRRPPSRRPIDPSYEQIHDGMDRARGMPPSPTPFPHGVGSMYHPQAPALGGAPSLGLESTLNSA